MFPTTLSKPLRALISAAALLAGLAGHAIAQTKPAVRDVGVSLDMCAELYLRGSASDQWMSALATGHFCRAKRDVDGHAV